MESNRLKQSLKQRHITMIAPGGVIGAGLFMGAGSLVASAGPAAILSYSSFCRSRQVENGQKQPIRGAYETRTDSEVALMAIQYYDRKASDTCTIVAGQESERFA